MERPILFVLLDPVSISLFLLSFTSICSLVSFSRIVSFNCCCLFLIWYPVIGSSSCILLRLVGRIFYHHFGRTNLVWITWPCFDIFCFFFLLPVSVVLFLLVVLSVLTAVVFFGLFISMCICVFFLLSKFRFLSKFFLKICFSGLISNSGFVFLFEFLRGIRNLS